MRGPTPPPSGIVTAALAWLGFALLIAAHFAIRPLFAGPLSVDFAMIAILFASVRMRPGLAAVVGCALGLALDALVPDHFGVAALVLTLLAYSASWLKAVFFGENIGLTGLFIFGGSWLFTALMLVLRGAPRAGSMVVASLVWAPVSAALTALVALLLLTLFRPLYRPTTS